MYRSKCTIWEREGYKLESYGNGAAYTLIGRSDGLSVHFQGDDATLFREEFDAAFEAGERCVLDLFSNYEGVMV